MPSAPPLIKLGPSFGLSAFIPSWLVYNQYTSIHITNPRSMDIACLDFMNVCIMCNWFKRSNSILFAMNQERTKQIKCLVVYKIIVTGVLARFVFFSGVVK